MNISSYISKPLVLWFSLLVTSAGGLVIARYFFPYAFALLHITITMNRQEALHQATLMAHTHKWGPDDYNQAASFETDTETKNFIELKAGGVAALTNVIEEGWYHPYCWKVRHFKSHNAHETYIYFTPSGKPYGFHEILSENFPGAALPPHQARTLVENKASSDWGITFQDYTLVESAQEKKISGRIDHTFSYERKNKLIGNAPYKLTLCLSGNRLTEVSYSIKVPESFIREYEHMRSANNSIAFAALFCIALLYIGLGCICGLGYLLYNDLLWLKPAALFATALSLLQSLNEINELPLAWMDYQTALSNAAFFLTIFSKIIAQFFLYVALLTLIFSVAEGLSRAAFKHHIVFWHVLNPGIINSWQIIGYILGSYLLIGITLAYSVSFYAFAMQFLGWWNPSETLTNPNIIATYIPWLGSLSQSMMAGCMEEALFRALPLAGAALIGQRINKKNLCLAFTFIVQAIIFGAAHANYAAQPAYARIIELIIPSFIFGGLYIAYGLLPAMLTHTLFDIFWFSLPLFLAQGLFINKMMTVIFSCTPLWITAYCVYRYGKPKKASPTAYNSSWQPPVRNESPMQETIEHHNFESLQKKTLVMLALGSIVALVCWLATTRFSHDNQQLSVPKEVIQQSLTKLIQKEYPHLAHQSWHHILFNDTTVGYQDLFVWQKAQHQFATSMGTYLPPAYWTARIAQFTGDLTSRAEEYRFFFDGNGELKRIAHTIPESYPGAQLPEIDAEKKAHEIITTTFKLQPHILNKISAESKKQPERIDWVFTYQDPQLSLPESQARLQISLAGDTVNDYQQLIFIPESWQRSQQEKETIHHLIMLYGKIILIIALGLFAFLLARRWRQIQIPYDIFFVIFGITFIKGISQLFNVWPLIEALFVTSEPYTNQQFTTIGRVFLQILMYSVTLGLGAALGTLKWRVISKRHPWYEYLYIGCSTGIISIATRSLLLALTPEPIPLFPDYRFASAYIPALGFLGGIINPFISSVVTFLIITCAADMLTNSWRKYVSFGLAFITLLLTISQTTEIWSISSWLIPSIGFSLIFTLLYLLYLYRYRPAIPYFVGTITICQIVQQLMFNAYPGVIIGAFFSFFFIACISVWWSKKLT